MKKRCKIVDLPTKNNSKSNIFCYNKSPFTSRKRYGYINEIKENVIPFGEKETTTLIDCSPSFQVEETDGYYIHLYLVSDDEIKEGDYVYCKSDVLDDFIDKVETLEELSIARGEQYVCKSKKVIATTDPSLNIPLIPEQFVKDYCDSNGIGEVMVDYDILKIYEKSSGYDGWRCCCGKWHYMDEQSCDCSYSQPITTIDNYISISSLKESWSREELPIQSIIQVLKYCEDNQIYDKLSIYDDFYYKLNEWVKRNV